MDTDDLRFDRFLLNFKDYLDKSVGFLLFAVSFSILCPQFNYLKFQNSLPHPLVILINYGYNMNIDLDQIVFFHLLRLNLILKSIYYKL